jgi:hypothetical protein
MKSSDLFSHPDEPEYVANSERSDEPVHVPAFSDRTDSTSNTPPSS